MTTPSRDSRRSFITGTSASLAGVATALDLTGVKTLAPTATALTLAADPHATNWIDSPETMVPRASKVSRGQVRLHLQRSGVVLTLGSERTGEPRT